MAQPTVYLAGPITGLTHAGATDWRKEVEGELWVYGIKAISPMRGKDYLATVGELSGHGREYFDLNVMSQPRSVMTRDRFDATRCDALLVNFMGAKRVSIGTVMEIAWADAKRTPIIIASDNDVHDHMMINEAAGFRVPTLEDAVHIAKVMLS